MRASATMHNRAEFICALELENPMFAFAIWPVQFWSANEKRGFAHGWPLTAQCEGT